MKNNILDITIKVKGHEYDLNVEVEHDKEIINSYDFTVYYDDLEGLDFCPFDDSEAMDGFVQELFTLETDCWITVNDYFDIGCKMAVFVHENTALQFEFVDRVQIQTNWAVFEITERIRPIDEAKDFKESHWGYSRGCFPTEPKELFGNSLNEIINDLIKTYGVYTP